MRTAAYQFDVTGDIRRNLSIMLQAVGKAKEAGVDLLVFPECAVTGYPPRNLPRAAVVDFSALKEAFSALQKAADGTGVHLIAGSIARDGEIYNQALLFSPHQPIRQYGKRALYGWDAENFKPGRETGVFRIGEYRIGVRICYEVRFPEYYRELYRAGTDLNITLFYDVSDTEDAERYHMIRSHLITRAVENATPSLSVNAISPYQTAPTCFIDASGHVLAEHARNESGMLIHDFSGTEMNFGVIGRRRHSDQLLGI